MRTVSAVGVITTLMLIAVGWKTALAQQIGIEVRPWTGEVLRPRGQPVIPLFDGWFVNDDDTVSLCFGYFNLNTEQSVHIPLGEHNSLEGDVIEAILPTQFDPVPASGYRRKFCPFTVRVPGSFGVNDRVVWTLHSAGATLSAHGHIKPPYALDEPSSDGRGNIAPLVKFSESDSGIRGRNGIRSGPLQAQVGKPLDLSVWIEHPDNRAWLGWSKYRGPGSVEFEQAEIRLQGASQLAATKVTFTEPGNYMLLLQTIDTISAFEFHCCWTNAYIDVNVSE